MNRHPVNQVAQLVNPADELARLTTPKKVSAQCNGLGNPCTGKEPCHWANGRSTVVWTGALRVSAKLKTAQAPSMAARRIGGGTAGRAGRVIGA